MAHREQVEFCESVRARFPGSFQGVFALDIGSLDINGNNHYLLDADSMYLGVDVAAGKNIDFVTPAHLLALPDATFDTIISTECLEHDQFWDQTLRNALRLLKPGGMLLMTCATTGRPEHGTRRTTPQDAPLLTGQNIAWSDYYRNLTQADVESAVDVPGQFADYAFSVNPQSHDLYFWGIKHGVLNRDRKNSFHLASYPKNRLVASLQQERESLNQERYSLQQQAEALRAELGAAQQRWAQAQQAAAASAEESQAQLQEAVDQWGILSRELAAVRASTSWRLTAPLRVLSRALAAPRLLAAALGAGWRHFGSLPVLARKVAYSVRKEGVRKTWRKARILLQAGALSPAQTVQMDGLNLYARPAPEGSVLPKVSVIVPNYNHGRYLRQRLDSIYHQTYGNFEVILLDDCSGDDSMAILEEYAERYADRTRLIRNTVNSGGPFRQWRKGLLAATGELVWIAESDDYSDPGQLECLVPFFQNPAVSLAFCRSDFFKDDDTSYRWTSEEYLADLQLDIWSRPFIRPAAWLVRKAWGVKNIVPNVSSALFRHPGTQGVLQDPNWQNMRLCGDWLFYLNLVRGGLVAYTPACTNHYRQHGGGTSVQVQKTDAYYREHEAIALALGHLYALDTDTLRAKRRTLLMHWRTQRGTDMDAQFDAVYSEARIQAQVASRKPNLCMVGFALIAGGGETFPIGLANLLKAHGYAVTFLNCQVEATEAGIRQLLRKDIPLLELDQLRDMRAVIEDFGIELVHTHHAWVDVTVANLLREARVAHVVTMHGMYEALTEFHLRDTLRQLDGRVHSYVYIADKNIAALPQSFVQAHDFHRISNAVDLREITPVPRATLGIGDTDFVLCLVSRGIPEKGWQEAIEARALAQARLSRPVHLVIVGNGPEYDRLHHLASDRVHFVGFQSNARDYFAMADLGLLPSRFAGESYPLVVIECLLAGRPVLASDIGAVAQMLAGADGLAGRLLPLDGSVLEVPAWAESIQTLASDAEAYRAALQAVASAAAKFDPDKLYAEYDAVYTQAAARAVGQVVP